MLKEAFDIYFRKLNDFWGKKHNSLPKVPFRKTIDTNLIQPSTIENGYVQWLPKLQNSVISINDVETYLGQKINPEVFQYFSTYCFLSLRGVIGNNEIELRIIPSNVDIMTLISISLNAGKKNFSDGNIYFEIGNACIDEDDSYLVYVDNFSGNVFAIEFNTNNRVEISASLYDLLKNMEAEY